MRRAELLWERREIAHFYGLFSRTLEGPSGYSARLGFFNLVDAIERAVIWRRMRFFERCSLVL